ncbi:hypothetical protein H8356DRAFT_1367684 [Neocallimastix lanati (nom. inval.)]|uniref:Uncharacterized protein n=1 Tax=Neocallimastix californiae TaxID=1754190 RepID=A0A1Y2D448_9FUNG|nr:hypothetical protein H8356DRAFT_1367684 [Neocallimastix sp. JGI-2020a]ORY54043.1 hypothetical protein LY90DRAFT_647662 [Neocallimastix californiae]|eukprot:ORY54043.1 hypothetical protein LY90DRAFT_647662 [Neocallimastix californiae]
MNYLVDSMNNLSYNQDIDEIKLFFDEDNYKISFSSRNVVELSKNIYFYSKNGTIFDFQNDFKNQIFFIYKAGSENVKVKFKNITFYNFTFRDFRSFMIMFYNTSIYNYFSIEFDNCTFTEIYSLLFYFEYNCYKSVTLLPQIVFNNCKFT